MNKISVLGAGSWGTALAILLNNNGQDVILWSALQKEVDDLNKDREHKSKLPGVHIDEKILITSDLELAMKDRDVLVTAVPSSFTRATAHNMKEYITDGQIIVNVAKGIEEATLYTLSEVIEDELPTANVTVLSGPSHAEEVGRGIPTTIVVGARKKETAEFIQNVLM